MTKVKLTLKVVLLGLLAVSTSVSAQSFDPPGRLVPGSGRGREDGRVWAPDMRFPIQNGPAYANSQVYGIGGYHSPRAGGQCDPANYSFPWHDNYCESRSWSMPLCPAGTGHQGQDIRPADCRNHVHPAVASADGTITNVGRFSVYLTAEDGTRYDYLHMSNVQVRSGQRVRCGDRLGMVSNVFGGSATTIHLHFNIRQAVRGVGTTFVPPYTSLVSSYGRIGSSSCGGGMIADAGMDASTGHDAGTTPPTPGGERQCFSTTTLSQVDSGDCVQVTRGACGSATCGTYQCVDGAWACPPSPTSCNSTTPATGCGMSPPPPPPAERRSCRSSVLGRDVRDGECVQVGLRGRDGEPPTCSSGCGVYQCNDGRWACSSEASCGGSVYRNAACEPSGTTCSSTVLGRNIADGECVQIPSSGCGESSCGWAVCAGGLWACTDGASCSDRSRHPHSFCGGASVDSCDVASNCSDCTRTAGCGWDGSACVSATPGTPGVATRAAQCYDCSGLPSCEPCAENGFCEWCPGSGCHNTYEEACTNPTPVLMCR